QSPEKAFVTVLIFCRESPAFLLSAGKVEDARRSLQMLRGDDYNIEPELLDLSSVVGSRLNVVSVAALGAREVVGVLVTALMLMFFQQYSGVFALLFNMKEMFQLAGVPISADAASITVACFQLATATAVAPFMDQLPRKLLLLVSTAVMAVALLILGAFFYLLEERRADNVSWIPIVFYILYIVAYSVGLGPVPWVLLGQWMDFFRKLIDGWNFPEI
ncbi:facilitated trehalose transporter Tret1-like, partial [Hyalella azteca]|uniref:Facilitated trehalose transporter Tret1-like n=1 Tax=Hyalella azteca TaxID=294128 RepID=A0A8B7P6S3_HYAAZ